MSSFKILTGSALAPALLFGITVHAAPASASEVAGLVQDSLGRPIAGAALSLRTVTASVIGHALSDASGRFVFSGVAQGTFAIQAEKSGFQMGTSIVTLVNGTNARTTVTLAAVQALEIQIAAKRLIRAQNGLSPETGGSVYRFDAEDIQKLPQGEATPLNQVLLQAPGVVNDSYGQIHIRGDHGNIQYRINGVMLPEGISGFGQTLDTRFAQNIDLLTGALPAQYGYRTAGVVEINTKSKFDAGGNLGLYGGSNGTFNPSFEYGNTIGDFSYFVEASYLSSNIGIENPTSSSNPLHDSTSQRKAFTYLSYLLNPTTKVSLMVGVYDGSFQIPNNPGQAPDPNNLGILGQMNSSGYNTNTLNSATLNDQQRETNRFAVTSLQGSFSDRSDYQVSLFTRYSSFHYLPDIAGNLAFNGVASDVFRSSSSAGIQADSSYRLNDTHTLRMGLFGSSENVVSNNTSTLFPLAAGLVSGPAYSISDNTSRNGNTLLGAYLQDEWKASGKLTINYGGRFDAVSAYVNEQQFSPRLGLIYKASEQTAWHAGYSRYFTPPPTELVSQSSVALFQNTTGAAVGPNLNAQVKSERSNYLDAGVTHQLTQTVSLGVDTFYKQSTNVLDEGQFGPALLMTPYNYAQGKIYGVELTGNYKSGHVSGYANLARTVSMAKDIISGQYLFDQATLNYAANNWINVDHQQALTISTGGAYLLSGTSLSGNMTFQSGLRNGFANTTSLPSYTVLNLGASRNMSFAGIGAVEARLVINNVLDKVYQIRDGSGIGVFAPQYGPRRGLFAGLSKKF
jgi:outer membrane receptor protein involved in Fe transport